MTNLNLKDFFKQAQDIINARYDKKYSFNRLNHGIICPLFFKGDKQLLTIQSPSEIESNLNHDSGLILIESPSNTKPDMMGLQDPFAWMQLKYGLIGKVLEQIAELKGKEVRITTSSDLIAHDEFIALLKKIQKHNKVKITMVHAWGVKDCYQRMLMSAAPSENRLNTAIKKLAQHGFKVTKQHLAE